MRRKLAELCKRDPLAREQAFHSIRVSPAIASREEELPLAFAGLAVMIAASAWRYLE